MCKGHVHALAAIRKAIDHGVDIQYTIVGDGIEKANIEAEIERHDLQERVRLVGMAGETEVLKHLQEADVFLLSSVGLGEAFPVSVMEAMACGLPVISSIIGATPSMIIHRENGFLVEQRDDDAIASALTELATDVELRQRMGIAARLYATENFDVRISAGRLFDAIESAVRQEAEAKHLQLA